MITDRTEKQPEPQKAGLNITRGMHCDWQGAFGLFGIYVLLIVILSILSPYFLSVNNFFNILVAVAVIGIMAVTTTMVIVSGGIDLSIGSVVAIARVIVALLPHVIANFLSVLVAR